MHLSSISVTGDILKDVKISKLIKNIAKRIYGDIIKVNFVMKVGTGSPAGTADQPYGFAFSYVLTFFDQRLFKVCIFCFEAVAVLHDDDPAVSVFPASENDQSVCR